jgi:hypothetical protein
MDRLAEFGESPKQESVLVNIRNIRETAGQQSQSYRLYCLELSSGMRDANMRIQNAGERDFKHQKVMFFC